MNTLPKVCAVVHPTTGEPVLITRGERGYRGFDFHPRKREPAHEVVKTFNDIMRVTDQQAQAMLAGSMFGWDCPAAELNAQPLTKS